MSHDHPLSRSLTRAAEAGGALRALLLAAEDERTSALDRAALRVLFARIEHALAVAPITDRAVRRNVAALAAALTRDDPPDDVLRA